MIFSNLCVVCVLCALCVCVCVCLFTQELLYMSFLHRSFARVCFYVYTLVSCVYLRVDNTRFARVCVCVDE